MNREELEKALEYYDSNDQAFVMSHVPLYIEAARERLAQLPEKCEHGEWRGPHRIATEGKTMRNWPECPGKVYPAELVERIADAIAHAMSTGVGRLVTVPVAAAVLDALNGETE